MLVTGVSNRGWSSASETGQNTGLSVLDLLCSSSSKGWSSASLFVLKHRSKY